MRNSKSNQINAYFNHKAIGHCSNFDVKKYSGKVFALTHKQKVRLVFFKKKKCLTRTDFDVNLYYLTGVTTMLNFFTTSNGFRSTLPVVSNLTAMNVWDGVCMCFIYASLLEFVCVNYVGRKRPLHNVVYRPGENPVTQVILHIDLTFSSYCFDSR